MVTAFVRIEGRWTMVIANDNTVASGSWWPRTPEKIERAQEMALRLRLPVVYLVDCSGLYLPEQSRSFPGRTGAGHIFKRNSVLSAAGVPQIAGVFGDCIAGGGYMPIISDRVYMTEQAYMVIAGAALIKGAKSQKLSSLDIGGPEVHVHQSGCADERVPDDETALDRDPRRDAPAAGLGRRLLPPRRRRRRSRASRPRELAGLFPADHRLAYDAIEVLARLVDHSLFWEVFAERGREMITGVGARRRPLARLRRQPPGPARRSRSARRAAAPAASSTAKGIAKLAAFSRACDDDGIPLVWLQDISGFDIGVEAERQGLLGYGSSLIYTNSTNRVPMFTVLLRKASGAGYYAMAGHALRAGGAALDADRAPGGDGGPHARDRRVQHRLDDEFRIAATDPEERAKIERGMRETEERIEGDMDPYRAASRLDTDEIVALGELRDWLELFAEASYQSTGYRRIKNPRIWSLHDLARAHGAARLSVARPESRRVARAAGRARRRRGLRLLLARGSGSSPARAPRATCWRRARRRRRCSSSGRAFDLVGARGRRGARR